MADLLLYLAFFAFGAGVGWAARSAWQEHQEYRAEEEAGRG